MLLAVGQTVPGWKSPVREGGEFNIDSAGVRLKLAYNTPQPFEIKGFRKSPLKIGLVDAGIHTLFFLFHLNDCTDGWADASYALGLVDPDYRAIDRRREKEGWLITAYFFDALNGMVHALRAATMTPRFSTCLDTLVARQRAALPEFTRAKHNAEIAAAHARWQTPSMMVKDAIITEIAGVKFLHMPPESAGSA